MTRQCISASKYALVCPLHASCTASQRALRLIESDLVRTGARYKSFDGLEIGAFVYRPPGHKRKASGGDGSCPVIVHPHGGPEGQHRPIFSPIVQYLASEMGCCVIDPNVRGSDGYGKVPLSPPSFQMKSSQFVSHHVLRFLTITVIRMKSSHVKSIADTVPQC